MDIIEIKVILWELSWDKAREYLEGYIRCLFDNKEINEYTDCELVNYLDCLYI